MERRTKVVPEEWLERAGWSKLENLAQLFNVGNDHILSSWTNGWSKLEKSVVWFCFQLKKLQDCSKHIFILESVYLPVPVDIPLNRLKFKCR